ncbi:MAG: protein translocase subunit SecF, partial [Clostridia bacterium]
TTIIKGVQDIRWGIDIRGGVEATFTPADGIEATAEELEAAKSIIEVRMVSQNITDYEIYTDVTNNRIIVSFPWESGETEFNPEAAIEELSATALLTFRKGMEYETYLTDEDGNMVYMTPSGDTAETIYIQGSDIVEAYASVYEDSSTGSLVYGVSFKLSDEGAVKFAEATAENVGETISIWMDDVMISYPTVESEITGGEGYISGDFTAAEATALATKIQAGALPFALEASDFAATNPVLGLQALDAMAFAGIIAFILIAIFMILKFRLPGAIAVLTLGGQIGITFAAISGYFPAFDSFTMTLPGIAGIILSIGMGVDANIITASRIKEELATGKTLDGAIQKGCQSSFSAIFDGNITIVIVAIMLIGVFGPSNILSQIFGESTTGAIYAFGFTLLVGVIGNFVMAVFASRLMLKSISGFKAFRNKALYGGATEVKTFNVDFYKNRKIFFGISTAIMAVGLVCNVIFGATLDIQFVGGAVIKYSVDGEVDQTEIAEIVKETTGREAEVVTSELLAVEGKQVTISFSTNDAISVEAQQELANVLSEHYADRTFEVSSSSSVEPTMGAQFMQKTIVCFVVTVLLLLAYIAFRFKKIGGGAAGITAVIALIHDVLIIYFVFIIFGMSINDIFMAVVLTILGYSLNDTIVIYDRIRENRKLLGAKATVENVMNTSLNQTLMRSILTSITTFIALLVVYIVSVAYGLTTVSTFALPMMVGVLSGCYSSLFIAAPIYTMLQNKKAKK